MINLFNYIDRPSPIHSLTGATKFVCLMLWSFAAMSTYDTRMLIGMGLASVILFYVGRIRLRDVSFMFGFTVFFLVINSFFIYLFSPRHGTEIYGTCTLLFGMTGKYALTAEQLFYHLNYILKFMATVPVVLLFVTTTNPSEFAASLNRIGVKYSVAYSVALALRYIPDVQRQYHEISQAGQARGIEMTKKTSLMNRLKAASGILIPLIMTSMDRIEVISNAMELRSFGKNKKRTWYMARPFKAADYIAMTVCALLIVLAACLTRVNGGRYYNPFIK
ncbi:MAG: energy-coupling factor transporter transmembrane protein EcfT [Lachnospiraceae bacterium]|nr:energy-coupling factor transporter transmembrane protein EcfT [Lachnospiraceae bacterium]